MLCSELLLVKEIADGTEFKPLPCNRWSCDYCAPRRKRRLIAQAASGEPNAMLTLTVMPHIGTGPTDRRNLLHDAWKRLGKRILRQFALPPAKRWKLASGARSPAKQHFLNKVTAQTPQRGYDRLHYMAFIERTKRGEPHLHILLRAPYIPQDWIAEQMGDMLGSPVCWIEKVNNTKHAIRYVTKYVAKEPAQFGTGKRYWVSRYWEVNKPDVAEQERPRREGVRIVRVALSDYLFEAQRRRQYIGKLRDGWFLLSKTPPAQCDDWISVAFYSWDTFTAKADDG